MPLPRRSILLLAALLLLPPCLHAQPGRWVRVATPTTQNLTRLFFLDNNRGWVGGDQGTVLITPDGGQTWKVRNVGLPFEVKDIFMVDTLRGFAVGHQYYSDTSNWGGSYLFRTVNGGNTWTWTRYQDYYFYTLFFRDSLRGLMGGDYTALWSTTDGGRSWAGVPRDTSLYPSAAIQRIRFHSEQLGMAVGGQIDLFGLVWQTNDGGEYWSVTRPDMLSEPVFDVHFWDDSNAVAVGGDFEYGASAVRTTNGGARWSYVYLGIFGQARSLSFRTPREGYSALGFPATYMVTYDSGYTWIDYLSPDTVIVNDVVFTDSLTGYIACGRGQILKYRHPSVSVGEEAQGTPAEEPILRQNYPNPFNPATTVSYELASAARVTLAVFDVLGREVRRLQEGVRPPGLHTVRFDGGGLPSGVYLCRLTVEGGRGAAAPRTEVQKMLLLR